MNSIANFFRKKKPVKKVTAIVVGAGSRGKMYASYAIHFPGLLQIVGVVDNNMNRRKMMQKLHSIPKENVFANFEEVYEKDRLSDCAIIATPDACHYENAINLAKKGYHILLEKPMATTEEHCRKIVSVCKENDVILSVCHVLRYLPVAMMIEKIIKSGRLGRIAHIQHTEPVGFWHFGHAYVRGNWRNESESCFSLLAKCCHDFDLIYNWMLPNKVKSLSSFGSLYHFRKENKPDDAGSRCVDCSVEQSCPYSAVELYTKVKPPPSWPTKVLCDLEDYSSIEDMKASVWDALKTGPYGRCAYECDNDVCDNQVTNMQFEDGATASITMIAFTQSVCARYTKIFGTKGELSWDEFEGSGVKLYDFVTRGSEYLEPELRKDLPKELDGHFGGDFYTISSFVEAVSTGDTSRIITGAEESAESHFLTFAAEKARKTGQVIRM